MKTKALVFDFGNVLVRWEPFLALKALFATPEQMEETLRRVGFYDWNLEQDRGRSWDEGLRIAKSEHPSNFDVFEAYRENLAEATSRAVPGMRKLLSDLADEEVPLFGLTNAPFEAVAHITTTVPELSGFRDIVVSAEEQVIKPDPEIYRRMVKRTGLESHQLLFIDDKQENCAAAEACGIPAIRFHSGERLTSQLREHSLIKT